MFSLNIYSGRQMTQTSLMVVLNCSEKTANKMQNTKAKIKISLNDFTNDKAISRRQHYF